MTYPEDASTSSSHASPAVPRILSIIIVNYNSGRRLEECVRAIRDSIGPEQADVIIVDNASHDASLDWDTNLFPGVTLIQSALNIGYGAAANRGASVSASPYLLILNPDIALKSRCAQRCLSFMNRFTQVGIASCRITDATGQMEPICFELPNLRSSLAYAITSWPARWLFLRRFLGRWMTRYHQGNYDRYVGYNIGAFILVRREAFEQCGGFDERFFLYAEEIDLYKRITDIGYKAAFISGAEAVHHRAQSSQNLPDKGWVQSWRGRFQYFDKHLSPGTVRFYRAACRLKVRLHLLTLSIRKETREVHIAKRACRKVLRIVNS